jgi:hypothetical protein
MKTFHAIAVLTILAMLCLNSLAAENRGADKAQPTSNPWFLQAQLTTTGNNLYFGETVSISGNTIVTTGGGNAYVFVRKGGSWSTMTQTATLTASDGSSLYSAAISGNTIVAGSYLANNFAGAAYVFVEPDGGWADSTETAKLTSSESAAGDFFGYSVAIAGNTIVVGGQQNDEVGITYPTGPGKAYVFAKPVGGWASTTETAQLTASDGVIGDDFGFSVAVLGDTVVVGAPDATVDSFQFEGAAYVFQKPGAVWKSTKQAAKLTTTDPQFAEAVGFDVGISGNTIVSSGDSEADIYVEPTGGWANATQTAQLTDPSVYAFDLVSTAICDQYILAGYPMSTNHPILDLFVEPSTGWANAAPTYRFSPPAANGKNGWLGWSSAIQGTTLVIGSLNNGGVGGNIVFVYGPY